MGKKQQLAIQAVVKSIPFKTNMEANRKRILSSNKWKQIVGKQNIKKALSGKREEK